MLNLLAKHGLFGPKHLVIIFVCIGLVVGLFLLSRKLKFTTVCKIMLYVGIVSETIKIFYYIIQNESTHHGLLPKTDLPFHLCSIQILFILIVNLTKNEKIKRFLLSFMYPSCLIGGFAAILIATDSSLNGMWILTAQYFLYHVSIMVLALNICTRKEMQLKVSDYFDCLKFLLVLMFAAVYINSIVNDGSDKINFMYVVSPPADGLPFLTEKYGWGVYITHYAALILFCVTMCYIKPIIVGIISKIKEKSAQNSLKPQDETGAGIVVESATADATVTQENKE